MHTYQQHLEFFNERLHQEDLKGTPQELYDPIVYTMQHGGKRLRPVLLLMACEVFGGKREKAIKTAMAFEIFHNFTLLHDDIMDRAPIRRGKASVYKKWNENIAILSGDTMFAIAYKMLIKAGPGEKLQTILELFTNTAIGVCEGQQFDMNFEKNQVELADYLEMIRLKTAILIAASLKAGALLGGADEEEQHMLYNCGENLGLAFQLKDDLLDVFADESKFGKQSGKDIEENKKTYLYLKALELAGPEDAERLRNLYAGKGFRSFEDKLNQTVEIFEKLNIRDKTTMRIKIYSDKAMEILHKLKVQDDKKTELRKTINKMLHRDH